VLNPGCGFRVGELLPPEVGMLLRTAIGDELRRNRLSQGRTLRDVSKAANVSLGYLSEIERGVKEPSSEMLAAICDSLNLKVSILINSVGQLLTVAEPVANVINLHPVATNRAA
jgi:transcriptional regulator with XRE-family HTH domain